MLQFDRDMCAQVGDMHAACIQELISHGLTCICQDLCEALARSLVQELCTAAQQAMLQEHHWLGSGILVTGRLVPWAAWATIWYPVDPQDVPVLRGHKVLLQRIAIRLDKVCVGTWLERRESCSFSDQDVVGCSPMILWYK